MTEFDLSIPGYRIERLLAKGGMANVYLAHHLDMDREVAIKAFHLNAANARFTERFLAEARMLGSLHHINIISIYDMGVLDNGGLYITMEYVQGGDLEKLQKEGLAENQALNVLIEMAFALQFLHNNNMIHCDIKPANILFRRDGTLILTDFGIAKRFQHTDQERSPITEGSPDYCSPEQAQGLPLDQRTDIYSLGVVFLKMLTGKNPYRGPTVRDSLMNHLQMDIPVLTGKQARYQPLLNNMLAKSTNERFSSMRECLDMLDELLIADSDVPTLSEQSA